MLKVFFGPLMGVNDRKSVSEDELREMQELLDEGDSLRNDTVGESAADVAMTAGDSAGLTEIGK